MTRDDWMEFWMAPFIWILLFCALWALMRERSDLSRDPPKVAEPAAQERTDDIKPLKRVYKLDSVDLRDPRKTNGGY